MASACLSSLEDRATVSMTASVLCAAWHRATSAESLSTVILAWNFWVSEDDGFGAVLSNPDLHRDECHVGMQDLGKLISHCREAILLPDINRLLCNWKSRLGLWPRAASGQTFTVASDCSGYGSELLALRLLGLQGKASVVMTCDVCPKKQALHAVMQDICGYKNASGPKHYHDMLNRNDLEAPCPSYSRVGKRAGCRDQRGALTLHGCRYLAPQRPRVVVLEQVSAILEEKHAQVWNFVQKVLVSLEYVFVYGVLNTRYMGIPQSRPRLYLVAVCKECAVGQWSMPKQRETHPDMHTFLDNTLVGSERLQLPHYEDKLGPAMWTRGWVLDIGASPRYISTQ